MFIEIPIEKLPHKSNIDNVERKLMKFSYGENINANLLFNAISSQPYLQSLTASLYNININGFPYYINIPNTSLSDLKYQSFIQYIDCLFEFKYAMVSSDSIVDKIMIKNLTPIGINILEKLYSLNKIDPIYKFIFQNFKSTDNDLKTLKIYIPKNPKFNLNCKVTNFHKYILWECKSTNSDIYGFPIGNLSLKDMENDFFYEFISFFKEVYIIGYGNPWHSTHIIVKINNNIINSKQFNINPYFI